MELQYNKNYCIIGPMRSGTTLLFRMVRDFSIDYNSKLNDEFFNTLLPQFGIEDTGLELINNSNPYRDYDQEIQYRINLLKKYNCKYTVKIVADQLSSTILDFLIKNYKIILIDRKNKYDQYLSLLIAEHSNVWNKGKQFKEFLSPFEASTKIAEDYFTFEKKWQEDQKNILSKTSALMLYYEDFINDPVKYLESHGIQTRSFSQYYKPLFKMRSQFEKEKLIINIDEIKKMYYNNFNEYTI